ncbi:MAG: IS1634 family transposase [Parachlamydiaceae bacterium]|nr:IS1634 family transposase [Parachlamydiaceae bacterium]
MEIPGNEHQSVAMDHHGLVAATCIDLKLANRIDRLLPKSDHRRVVSTGQSAVAMILNGLGFTNRRLYLTHQFFENKPIQRLLGVDIKASDLTDDTLGRALDEIASYGSSKLFGEIAFDVALENNLLKSINHLDTTSLTVHGSYDAPEEEGVIKLNHGYSKDHRPDLKQAVLSLVVNGPSAMPIWMEPLNGNSSDKTSFHETIKKIEEFKRQIDLKSRFKWVADSALYTEKKLLKNNDYLWLTRVPENIKEAKKLVQLPMEDVTWVEQEKGYKTSCFISNYGDIEQRWLLVFSEQAYKREKKTFDKRLLKQEEELKKELWHLGCQEFQCEEDAKSALKKLAKKYRYYEITSHIEMKFKYKKKGRPKENDEQEVVGYIINSRINRNEVEIKKMLKQKGRFILATNDMDTINYPDIKILSEYKEQQSVEHGFRFLKDPWFMIDSIFLKTPKRIEALMMIMTMCLMVYNISQYKLRETLKSQNETLPNQLNKQIQNPTMRWIFQLMEGISISRYYDHFGKLTKECMVNLSELRIKIIRLFGETASYMYGLIKKNPAEVLGT